MNKKTKMTLIAVLSVVVLAAVLLVPFVTLNVDGPSFMSNKNNVSTFENYVDKNFVLLPSVTDSTSDNFNITFDNGKKSANVKLNIKKLLAAMELSNKTKSASFPVKTNILHTMYLV